MIRPEVLRLRRLVLGEAGRFPELARTYYERMEEGRLRSDDPLRAAHHFAWLTLGMPLDRGMFYPAEAMSSDVNLDILADAAVRVFLAAYAPTTAGTKGPGRT